MTDLEITFARLFTYFLYLGMFLFAVLLIDLVGKLLTHSKPKEKLPVKPQLKRWTLEQYNVSIGQIPTQDKQTCRDSLPLRMATSKEQNDTYVKEMYGKEIETSFGDGLVGLTYGHENKVGLHYEDD